MTNCFFIERVVGNTGADLYTEFEGVDLSLLLGLSVNLRRNDGVEITHDAVIDDAPAGQFHIEWAAGDLVEGDHRLEYVVVDALSKVSRLPAEKPLVLRVRGQV